MDSEYVKVFKAFSDKKRVRILELLCESEEECACVLLDDLQISQATLSHHMKILCESGIVKSRKEGKWNYYSINEAGCDYACVLLQKVKEKRMDKAARILAKLYTCIKPVTERRKDKEKQEDQERRKVCCC